MISLANLPVLNFLQTQNNLIVYNNYYWIKLSTQKKYQVTNLSSDNIIR